MICFKADHAAFRNWICIEVLWLTIERHGNAQYKSAGQIHKHVGPGESFEDFMEATKQVHKQEAFSYKLGIMKTRGKQEGADVKKILAIAGHC